MALSSRGSATSISSHATADYNSPHAPTQRRRSLLQQQHRPSMDSGHDGYDHAVLLHEHESTGSRSWKPDDDKTERERDGNISLSVPSKAAEKIVTPFLTKHIPASYNPVGGRDFDSSMAVDHPSKYCYRHRPDLKCRRQANEPSMEVLQKELSTVSKMDQQSISHVWSLFSAAPAKQRDLMLRGILVQCCFPQLSMISASIRELIKIDFLFALPAELGYKILGHLDTTSLCKAAQVSRHWRALADDDVVWHKMCEQHIDRKCTKCGWGLPLLERKRLRTEKRGLELRAAGTGLPNGNHTVAHDESSTDDENSNPRPAPKRPLEGEVDQVDSPAKRICSSSRADTPDSQPSARRKRPWKDVYKQRFKVGTNWKYGRCRTKVFKAHDNGIMCLQFSDNILATGSYDSTIKIWDLNNDSATPEPIQILRGHDTGIRCLQFDDQGLLISGSIDKTIRMWDWRTGALKRVLRGHSGGVIALHWGSGILVSGSQDHTVRVWDSSANEVYTLRGHTDWVNSVKLDIASRTVLSASDDCTVKLWDLDTRQCILTLEGHVGQVQQLVVMPPEFELDAEDLVSADGHETDTDNEEPHLNGHDHDAGDQLPPSTNSSEATENGGPQQHPTTPLYHGSKEYKEDRPEPPKYILTGSLDSTIRLWHLPTGKCLRTFFGHLEGIWALAADTLRVVSGAEDRMVKVWDPRSGKNERVFTGHAGPVTCIGLSDSRLVTGSEDCDIRVMEFGCQEEDEKKDESFSANSG